MIASDHNCVQSPSLKIVLGSDVHIKDTIEFKKHLYSIELSTVLIISNELSQKTRFQSVQIAALWLYNIQRESLVFKKSLCMT